MSELIYEKKGNIAYVTLNRPEKLNALSLELADGLREACHQIDDDPDVWAGIFTGAGDRSFCAGADLNTLDKLLAESRAHIWEAECVLTYMAVKKPLIAAINGYCLGGGLQLALACDLRIASENAQFGTPDQKINTVDSFVSLALPYMIPSAIAMELILTGDFMDANEAYRVGLVNKVVPQEELLPEATRMAERIFKNGPQAIKAVKQLGRRGRTLPLEIGLELFESLSAKILDMQDTREAIKAFWEKRPPVWKGK